MPKAAWCWPTRSRSPRARRPELMVDFATLTGACVNALTERYSGAFTNRPQWHEAIRSGRRSQRRARVAVPDGRGLRQRPGIFDRRRPAMHARQQGRSHPRRALPEPLRPRAGALDPHRPGGQQSQRRPRPRSDGYHRLWRAIHGRVAGQRRTHWKHDEIADLFDPTTGTCTCATARSSPASCRSRHASSRARSSCRTSSRR